MTGSRHSESDRVHMSRRGFLHRDVETHLFEHYMAGGAEFSLATNSEELLQAARKLFLPVDSPAARVDFSLRFWVDSDDRAEPPWPKPYVRGLDHLVFAAFDTRSSLLVNLRTRRVIGRFSSGIATNADHWKMMILPIVFSILAGSVRLIELHASCVANDDAGLVLLGPSRCGKSTLAMALIKMGFRFLSDDRTFCSMKHGKLLAWGLPRPLKLRRDGGSWFDDFRDREPTGFQNGESVFHLDPGPQRIERCEPRLLVFLDRVSGTAFSMTPIAANEARLHIERDLLAESPEAVQWQEETLDHLLSLPRFTLRFGGQPQEVAEQLAAFFLNQAQC